MYKKKSLVFLLLLLLVVITVTCKKNIPVTAVTLNLIFLPLTVGETEILTPTVLPVDATNKEILWTSDNPIVATVVNGLVIPHVEGTATITATTLDGNKTAGCNVKVYKYVEGEPEMVIVEGGTFTMGCTKEQGNNCFKWEYPIHKVTVDGFKIGKYPITQKQWETFMGNNPSHFKGGNLPVERVSWEDAQEFIAKLNAATGKNYRLATEAEWEFAARGGNLSKGYRYSGSDNPDEIAWYNINSGNTTLSVGTKAPNELGIYDMSGNIWEWCNDWYGSYSAKTQTNPLGPVEGSYRVGRGGSWSYSVDYCRVSYRYYADPKRRDNRLGLRIAYSL